MAKVRGDEGECCVNSWLGARLFGSTITRGKNMCAAEMQVVSRLGVSHYEQYANKIFFL